MRYKIVKGLESIREVFDNLKKDPIITSSYSGKTIENVCQGNSGIVYEPKLKKITIVGDKNNNLIKRFYTLIYENKIKLIKCQ